MEEQLTQTQPGPALGPEQLVAIPAALLQDLLMYLGGKPHTEVEPYIKAINSTAKLVNITQK